LPNALRELPYGGAMEMLLAEDVEERELLKKLFEAICGEISEARQKKQTNL